MSRRDKYIFLVAIPLTLVLACSLTAYTRYREADKWSPFPPTPDVTVSYDDFVRDHHISTQITGRVGDQFDVVLCSKLPTGVTWSESAQISDSTVVIPELSESEVIQGQETWIFRILKEGKSTIYWEGGEQGEWTFTLTVKVK